MALSPIVLIDLPKSIVPFSPLTSSSRLFFMSYPFPMLKATNAVLTRTQQAINAYMSHPEIFAFQNAIKIKNKSTIFS